MILSVPGIDVKTTAYRLDGVRPWLRTYLGGCLLEIQISSRLGPFDYRRLVSRTIRGRRPATMRCAPLLGLGIMPLGSIAGDLSHLPSDSPVAGRERRQ